MTTDLERLDDVLKFMKRNQPGIGNLPDRHMPEEFHITRMRVVACLDHRVMESGWIMSSPAFACVRELLAKAQECLLPFVWPTYPGWEGPSWAGLWIAEGRRDTWFGQGFRPDRFWGVPPEGVELDLCNEYKETHSVPGAVLRIDTAILLPGETPEAFCERLLREQKDRQSDTRTKVALDGGNSWRRR